MSVPTTEPAKRLATIMRRRLSTSWTPPEIAAYKALVKAKAFENMEDLLYVETYYSWNWRKEGNICRTSLLTLLRHFPCEVDRARRWAELHPAQFRKSNPDIACPRNVKNTPRDQEKTMSDEEWKSLAKMTQTELRNFRENFMKRNVDAKTENV